MKYKFALTLIMIFFMWPVIAEKDNAVHRESIAVCTEVTCDNEVSKELKTGSFAGFFGSIFDTSDWPARWYCGTWTKFHGWMYIGSDIGTWLAYFAIPIILFYFLRRKREIEYPFKGVLLLFILFIAFCGLTHLVDAIIFWKPVYKLSALIRSGTAIVSLTTVFALIKVAPRIVELKSPDFLEKKVEERTKALKETNRRLAKVILEKEEAERKLKQYNKELETAKRRLDDKVDALDQTNQSLKEFAYAASHDLQEPLRIITNYSQLLNEKEQSLQDTSRGYLEVVISASKKMKVLIDDLLNYSIESQNKGELATFNLSDVIENVKVDLQVNIQETGADIRYSELPDITANFGQMQRLFQNLISNSMKYRIEGVKPIVDISAQEKEEDWLISVQDNGIGIDKKHVEKIFQIFYRLHGKGKFEGTGIGLALCKRIVANHKGDIWATSLEDGGLKISFTISKNLKDE